MQQASQMHQFLFLLFPAEGCLLYHLSFKRSWWCTPSVTLPQEALSLAFICRLCWRRGDLGEQVKEQAPQLFCLFLRKECVTRSCWTSMHLLTWSRWAVAPLTLCPCLTAGLAVLPGQGKCYRVGWEMQTGRASSRHCPGMHLEAGKAIFLDPLCIFRGESQRSSRTASKEQIWKLGLLVVFPHLSQHLCRRETIKDNTRWYNSLVVCDAFVFQIIAPADG